MKNAYNIRYTFILFICIAILFAIYATQINTVETHIFVKGKKPKDADISLISTYYGGGSDCQVSSWNAANGKVRSGNKIIIESKNNIPSQQDHYNFNVNMSGFTSKGCEMELYEVYITAKNNYDLNGFAKLRLHKFVDSESVLPPNTVFKAINCQPIYLDDLEKWSNGIACDFTNSQKEKIFPKSRKKFNHHSEPIDFNLIPENGSITYDIYAGENYRSEPMPD